MQTFPKSQRGFEPETFWVTGEKPIVALFALQYTDLRPLGLAREGTVEPFLQIN